MVDKPSWDDRFADFLERVMATAVANGDPRPLQEEYNRLLAECPAAKKKSMGLKPMDVAPPKATKEKPDARPTR